MDVTNSLTVWKELRPTLQVSAKYSERHWSLGGGVNEVSSCGYCMARMLVTDGGQNLEDRK